MGGFRLAAETKKTELCNTLPLMDFSFQPFSSRVRCLTSPTSPRNRSQTKVSLMLLLDGSLYCNALWLLLVLIARKVEDLCPSSQIEIATMAVACCSIFTYLAVRAKNRKASVSSSIYQVRLNSWRAFRRVLILCSRDLEASVLKCSAISINSRKAIMA